MTDTIKTTIGRFPFGFVFTPSDFPIDSGKQASVNRILNSMDDAGDVRCLSKGGFYKPLINQFGEIHFGINQL